MKLLIPFGLLGLLGLIALLLIYIIKPNFQKKVVSSTYVWKLSLKYRKRRNPISRFQDLIILIMQIIAIIICAFLMAQPVLEAFRPPEINQKIAIIDASASMLTVDGNGETRFKRAVSQVKTLAKSVTEDNGEITVIVADDKSELLSVRVTASNFAALEADLDALYAEAMPCTYGSADISGAMDLAESVLAETPRADVYLYTDKEYIDKGFINVVDVSDYNEEYNVAILDSTAELIENYYTFNVDVACYGKDIDISLSCVIYGINETDENVSFEMPVRLDGDEVKTISFNAETAGWPGIYSYKHAYVSVDEPDSFYYDNMFYIYGGEKETIRIQYCSDGPNIFFRSGVQALREALKSRWNIEYVELTVNATPAIEGFDLYIFERKVPNALPKDGAVLYVNPERLPAETGMSISTARRTGNMYLAAGDEHPVTAGVVPERILITEYRMMTVGADYRTVLTCFDDPVMVVKNDSEQQIAVMSFDLRFSDVSMQLNFTKLLYQTFNYFIPSTITRYNYEVGETVDINARSPSVIARGPQLEETFTQFPATITLANSGSYTLVQTVKDGTTVTDSFYVKIPNAESDLTSTLDVLINPYVAQVPDNEDYDLLLFIAGALVLILLVEWELHIVLQ